MSQCTQGEDLTLQFFRGYLHSKYWASLAAFLPETKGLQVIWAVETMNI